MQLWRMAVSCDYSKHARLNQPNSSALPVWNIYMIQAEMMCGEQAGGKLAGPQLAEYG